nr:uncharacterized protein LOC113403631 isoform X2 [Vanessa tameamea]
MHIATLIALVQLSLATAVSDVGTLTAAELNLELAGDGLSPFFEDSSGETGVNFVRGSRAADSPLSPDIDVQCSADYIQVTVEFSDIYDGIIYSKGFLNDPKCKYVSSGGSQSRYSFRVPLNGCGSRPLCNACGTIDNVLVFQGDELVQGSYDFARKVSCAGTALEVSTGVKKEQSHVLKLKPFMVDMLDVVAVQGPAGGVECWMDIQKGVFPQTTPLENSIKIGEYLTILIYLKDIRNQFNLKIHDCWAYDNENYDSSKTNKIQLTDKDGCPKKKKFIDSWQKSTNTGKSGATLIAYSKISAFRFPETDQVYLTCNVELCTSNCDASCNGIIKEITTVIPDTKCYPGSTDPLCSRPTTSAQPNCFPGNNDPRCPKLITPPPPNCFPGTNDPRCPKPTTTAPPRCFPGSNDPRCPKPTTPEAPRCYPGSSDPRCPKPTTPEAPRCYPGSSDPRCPKPTTLEAPRCYPGSSDPRCPKPTTPEAPRCYPGSTDPRCPQPTKKPSTPSSCYPGSKDPKCPQPFAPSSTNPPSTYLPPFPLANEVKSPRVNRLAIKSFDYYDSQAEIDNFDSSRTKPKTRNVRDVSKSFYDEFPRSLEYSAIVGSVMFVILSLGVTLFIYKNKASLKRKENVAIINTHPC